jgi:hypothetical protein
MKVTELRIGNYINGIVDEGDNETPLALCVVSTLDSIDMAEWPIICTSDVNAEWFDGFKPIKITAEWLLKFGIKRINNSMFRFGAITFQATHIDDGGGLSERLLSTRKAFKICLAGKFICNIEHIHQLQNLYFALTGEELEIK